MTVAVVTGGHKRLGRAVALALAHAGADVAVLFRQQSAAAAEVVQAVTAMGRQSVAVQVELTDSAAVGRALRLVAHELGGLDWLVAAAASFEATPLASLTGEALDRVLQNNARAPVDLVLQALPFLRESADARVVLFGDLAAERPFGGYLAHSMAKAALHAAVRGLAAELGPAIAVNGIAPGAVLAPAEMTPNDWRRLQDRAPQGAHALRDPGLPLAAIAETVGFLLTCPRYVSGQIVAVDGGRSARW